MNLFHCVGSPFRTAAVLLPDESEYANVRLAGYGLLADVECYKTSLFVGLLVVLVENDCELRFLWGTLEADRLQVFMDICSAPFV